MSGVLRGRFSSPCLKDGQPAATFDPRHQLINCWFHRYLKQSKHNCNNTKSRDLLPNICLHIGTSQSSNSLRWIVKITRQREQGHPCKTGSRWFSESQRQIYVASVLRNKITHSRIQLHHISNTTSCTETNVFKSAKATIFPDLKRKI